MAIKINNLYYTYNKNTMFEHLALQDITLDIKQGSFSAIVGQTGSGKSSLIQHLNAILVPEQGSIDISGFHLDNQKSKQNLKKLREKVGLVFQFSEYQLFEETILKDVMFGPLNFGINKEEAQEKAYAALALVGIDESLFEQSPFDLSGGQKRRVAIAGVLAIDPDIIVLDEPTAGLDPQGLIEVMNIFKNLNKVMNKTIVLVTHDMNIVYDYASEVVLMADTKLINVSDPISFFNSPDIKKYSIELPNILNVYHNLFNKLPNYKITFDDLISEIVEGYTNVK